MPRTRDINKSLWGFTDCYCLQCQFPLMPVIGPISPIYDNKENS